MTHQQKGPESLPDPTNRVEEEAVEAALAFLSGAAATGDRAKMRGALRAALPHLQQGRTDPIDYDAAAAVLARAEPIEDAVEAPHRSPYDDSNLGKLDAKPSPVQDRAGEVAEELHAFAERLNKRLPRVYMVVPSEVQEVLDKLTEQEPKPVTLGFRGTGHVVAVEIDAGEVTLVCGDGEPFRYEQEPSRDG